MTQSIDHFGTSPATHQPASAVQYPKGDLRRMLSVLAVVSGDAGATLVQISAQTGLDKRSVLHLIVQAEEQASVRIDKSGPLYTLAEWGPLITQGGIKNLLTGCVKRT